VADRANHHHRHHRHHQSNVEFRNRGTNIGLEEKLDEVFSSKFKMRGKSYPALVAENRRPTLLAKYYADMAETRD
jgi:hypothetical protein